MMNEIKSQLTIFFVLIGLFNLLTCTPADEEYDFLKINYQYSKFSKDQSFDIDVVKSRLVPLSMISNYNKTFKLSTLKDFTKRKLMIVSKLSTRYEILDFLSTIKNTKGVFTMAIGLISETHFQLYKPELAEVSDFDVVSSLYFCTYNTYKPSLINRTSAEFFLKPNKCYELYAIKQTTILKVVPFQQPSNAHNIFEVLEPIFHEQAARRSNFRGVHIVAETVDYKFASHLSSFIRHRQPNSTNTILLKEGLEIEIFRCLRDALNFTEKAVESDGYLVMAEDKTVNNSGLAKFLHEDTADISISLAEYIPYRMSGQYGIRYLHSVYRSEAIAYFVQPHINEYRNIFMMPFSWDLWLTIGIFIVFIYFLGNLFSFIYFRKKHRPFLKLTTKRRNSTGIWMLAAITQRGYHKFLRIKHAKILVFTTLMTSQVVYVGYTSSMCSILSVDVIPIKKFKNFENHFKLYVDKYVPTIYYRIEWLRNMSLLNIPATQILKSEAIPLILSTSSALVTTADEFYPAFRQYSVSSQDNSACEKIDSVTSDGFYIQQGMFVKPGSPFREHFNIKLLLIRERGLQTRYLNKYFEASTLRCLDLKHSFFNTISFQDVVTAFVFLLLVYLLSLIALVIEVCQSRKRRIVYAI